MIFCRFFSKIWSFVWFTIFARIFVCLFLLVVNYYLHFCRFITFIRFFFVCVFLCLASCSTIFYILAVSIRFNPLSSICFLYRSSTFSSMRFLCVSR